MIARSEVAALPPEQIDELEASAQLVAHAGTRIFEPLDAQLIVRHVLVVVDPQAGWPVQRAALEGLIRRMNFARRDELLVAGRPAKGAPFGAYSVRRPRQKPRPYLTLLRSIEPLGGSCDCPDYLRNSLGLCKHLLTVLIDVAGRPRTWQRALSEEALRRVGPQGGIVWDPIRPLVGAADWLQRVRWEDGASPGRGAAAVKGLFDPRTGALRNSWDGDLVKRTDLLGRLQGFLRAQARRDASILDPALVSLVETDHARSKARLDSRPTKRVLQGALRPLRLKLYSYQKEAVARFVQAERLLLADDMGLGKTAQAIAGAMVLFQQRRVRRGLIVCPAALKAQWHAEWLRFSYVPVAVVDGTPEDRARIYEQTRSGFLIVNYEQLLRDSQLVADWDPQMVVLDEAQRIKNWATKTALAVKRLQPRYRLILTGTPLENRLEELASVVEWVDDFALEPKWRLDPWHAVHGGDSDGDGGRGIVGIRGLDTLRARLDGCMLRRVRQEVIDQLPPRTDSIVALSMTDEQCDAHDELSRPIARIVQTAGRRPLKQAEFLRLMTLLGTQRVISNGLAQQDFQEVWPTIRTRAPTERLLGGLSSPKLAEFRELLRQLLEQGERKVVVFSQWRRALDLAHWSIHDLLAKRGERAVFFTGKESQKRRTHNIVDFHDDPSARVFFASDAGGTGLNLQRAANCVVNFELPWNPAVLEQRVGRVYRLGQEHPIDVYNLVTTNSIEARIAQIVQNKQALFAGLFDGTSDSILFESSASFLDQLKDAFAAEEDDGVTQTSPDDDPDFAEVEATIAAADESTDVDDARPVAITADPGRIRDLFAGVRVETHDDGSLTLRASPDAARTLAAMFDGVAQLLTAAGGVRS